MDIQRTVTIVIGPDPDLARTLEVFRQVQAELSPTAFNDGRPLGPVALQRAAYHRVKGGLNSQMTVSAVRAVAAAYHSAKRNRHPFSRPFAFRKPHALFLTGKRGRDSDSRTDGTLSIWTGSGPKRLPYSVRDRTRTFALQTAKRLIDWVPENAVLVFEDLHGIPKPERGKVRGRAPRRRLSLWQHRAICTAVKNKAQERGPLVADAGPPYTSQACSRCGLHGIRRRHAFQCPSCGYLGHADVNAAQNIRLPYTASLDRGPLSVGPEPLVGHSS